MLPLLVALFVSTATSAHHHHGGPNAKSPEPYVARALTLHPSLAAAASMAEAMRVRAEPAGAFMDPMLSVGIANLPYDPLSITATPMTGIRIGVSQMFPWPGKRDLRAAVVELGADALDANADEQRNALAASVRSLFYDLHFVDVAMEVVTSNLDIIDGFVQIADAKYRVGRGLQQDVLKARVARGQLEEQQIDLGRRRAALAVRLALLAGVDASEAIPSLVDVPVTGVLSLDHDALIDLAEGRRPRLRSQRAKVEQAAQKRLLAEKDAYPDFTVAFGYTIRVVDPAKDPTNGADFLSLSTAINLPVWYGSKQGPLVQAAGIEQNAAVAALEAERLAIDVVVSSALEQIPKIEKQMDKFRDSIIPTTRQTLDADRVAYQVDKVDFLNLLDIEMRLLRFEVDYHRLHVEREKLIVALAEAIGVAPSELAGSTP